MNGVVGGWRLTANFNAEGGLPLQVSGTNTSVCDELQTHSAGSCRLNLIGSPKFAGNRSREQQINQWINPAAFEPAFGSDQNFWANYDPTDPRAWQFGNTGPRLPNMRSPGFWNVDTSLVKEFHITESKYLQIRWEMFNALNHQNLGIPDTGYCLPPLPGDVTDLVHQDGCSFGRITNVQTDARAMEFALKFFW